MRLDRYQRAGVYEGIFASMFSALTSTFIAAFALFLGADTITIALLASVPLVFSILAYLPAAFLVEKTGKTATIASIAALFARGIWFLMVPLPFFFPDQAVLIAIVAASSLIGTFTAPSWASLIADIVPLEIRGKYFSFRNKLTVFFGLLVTITGGIALDMFNNLLGFSIIFILGAFFGVLSAGFFKKMGVDKKPQKIVKFGIRTALEDKILLKFLIVMLVFRFGVEFAQPFMVIEILNNLNLGYIWLSIFSSVSALSTIFFAVIGDVTDRFGNRAVIIISAFLASSVPLVWIFSFTPEVLVIVYVIHGAAWGWFNLATFNYILSISPKDKRPTYSSLFWLVPTISAIASPLIAGIVALSFAQNPIIFNEIRSLFLIAGIIQIFGSILFLKYLEEVKKDSTAISYVANQIFRTTISTNINRLVYIRKTPRNALKLADHLVKDMNKKVSDLEEEIEAKRREYVKGIVSSSEEIEHEMFVLIKRRKKLLDQIREIEKSTKKIHNRAINSQIRKIKSSLKKLSEIPKIIYRKNRH